MNIFGIKLRIRTQLIAIFVLFALIPTFLVSIIAIQDTGNLIDQANQDQQSQLVAKFEGLAYQIGEISTQWIQQKEDNLNSLVGSSNVQNSASMISSNNSLNVTKGVNNLQNEFTNFLKSYNTFTEVEYINYGNATVLFTIIDGVRRTTHTSGDELSNPYYIGAKKNSGNTTATDQLYLRELYVSSTLGDYSMGISKVVRTPNNDIVGVIVLRIDYSLFWNFFNKRDSSNNIINAAPRNQEKPLLIDFLYPSTDT